MIEEPEILSPRQYLMNCTRRDLGRLALTAAPFAGSLLAAAVNSQFNGVHIGAITYSFRTLRADQIVGALVKAGLGEVELMSNHSEALAGAPSLPAGGPGQEALKKWRGSVSMDRFKAVRKQFSDAGVDVQLLCYNMDANTSDDEIEYAFNMAKALGVRAISCSTQVSVSKRIAPFADKHQLMIGMHNHSNVRDLNEFATPKSFATAMGYSKFIGVNLDIGHFTAGNNDPVAYLKDNHARITNLHLKDRKKDDGDNVPWGTGDTPIKEVLQLLRKEKWAIPANIEYEYQGRSDSVTEVARCVKFCKDALA